MSYSSWEENLYANKKRLSTKKVLHEIYYTNLNKGGRLIVLAVGFLTKSLSSKQVSENERYLQR